MSRVQEKGESLEQFEEKEKETEGDDKNLQPGVKPRMFKHLVAGDHPDFSTPRQQDALQFLQYFLEQLEEKELPKDLVQLPSDIFGFRLQERLQCTESVRITHWFPGERLLWSVDGIHGFTANCFRCFQVQACSLWGSAERLHSGTSPLCVHCLCGASLPTPGLTVRFHPSVRTASDPDHTSGRDSGRNPGTPPERGS